MSAPTPYQRPYRPRSVFGPLVLVLVGVSILLYNMGLLTTRGLGWWFARYWPVILILWGVVKLLEFMWARQRGYATPRLGGGSIVFLVFFILFGVLATNSLSWDWQGFRNEVGNDFDFGDMWGKEYDYTDNFATAMASPQQIRVLGRHGDITIKSSADGQAHAVIEKNLRSDSQSEADRINQSSQAKFEQQGNIWVLDLTGNNFEHGRFNLDLELPPAADLSVSTRNGNITVEERPGNVDLSTDHGEVSVEQVKGNAILNLKNGSVTAKNVTGNVIINGGSDITLENVSGTVTLSGGYPGELRMSHIAKQVHFSSSRTDLQFERLDGDLTMESDNLHANAISGPFRLETHSKSVHLEDVSGEVHIDDKNATIEVQGKAPLGNTDITSLRGEIDVSIPANAAFQLDAQSKGGRIQASDYNITTDNDAQVTVAKTTVGKGGPMIRLRADHGTIQIRKNQ